MTLKKQFYFNCKILIGEKKLFLLYFITPVFYIILFVSSVLKQNKETDKENRKTHFVSQDDIYPSLDQ